MDLSGFMKYRYAASYRYGVFTETFIGTICNIFVQNFTDVNTKVIATILEILELVAFAILFMLLYRF